MAEWHVVSPVFDNAPSEEQAELITRRIKGKASPAGAESASSALSDYDFPGFTWTGDRPCLDQARWRSPILDLDKFQAILHVLDFPNRASGYSEWQTCSEEPPPLPPFARSTPKKLSETELCHVKALFPEFPTKTEAADAAPNTSGMLQVSGETLRSLKALNVEMFDINPVSRHVTCCKCGKALGPQLLRRHFEFFEAEGPLKGEFCLRVRGWSCLNGCSRASEAATEVETPGKGAR